MLSRKTKYAFKALIQLARVPFGQSVLIAELSQSEKIPRKFLEFILLSLRKGGLLHSKIGKGGGYSLAVPASRITLAAVIKILEGDSPPVPCLSAVEQTVCDECSDITSCGIRLTMIDVHRALTSALESCTIGDMVSRSETERSRLHNIIDFSI